MVVIPPGEFVMGSPDAGADARREEGPAHRVTIARSFAMSKYEITWAQWEQCMKEGACAPANDEGYGRGQHPVINIDLHDARRYAAWLSKVSGKTYRLPSEAEWEYAARAGSAATRHWGDEDGLACQYANVFNVSVRANLGWKWVWDSFPCEDGHNTTAHVGRFSPNAFGLHDMLGNVREWTEDCFDDDYASVPTDGRPMKSGACEYFVTRGGSWVTEPIHIRSASRYWNDAGKRNDDLGIRIVREIP